MASIIAAVCGCSSLRRPVSLSFDLANATSRNGGWTNYALTNTIILKARNCTVVCRHRLTVSSCEPCSRLAGTEKPTPRARSLSKMSLYSSSFLLFATFAGGKCVCCCALNRTSNAECGFWASADAEAGSGAHLNMKYLKSNAATTALTLAPSSVLVVDTTSLARLAQASVLVTLPDTDSILQQLHFFISWNMSKNVFSPTLTIPF